MPDRTPSYPYSAHLGYLFTELPFERRFAAARVAGFQAVEHPAPYPHPPAEIVRLLADEGLSYVQFGLPSGDAAKGEKGIAMIPDRVAEFRESVSVGLDYAEAVGVTMVHAMAGVVTGETPRDRLWGTYLENLAFAAEKAAARGVTVLVEAMSPGAVPDYLVDTPARAAEAVRATGAHAAQLLDVFHATSVGADPVEIVRAEAGRIGHVHFADHPGRHEPGTGTIDFDAIREALAETGYAGAIGCEYAPRATTSDGIGWLAAVSDRAR